MPGSKLEYLSKGRAFEVWKNADGTTAQHTSINDWLYTKGYLKMTPKRYKEFFNEICKEEGVYELCIGWKTEADTLPSYNGLPTGNFVI